MAVVTGSLSAMSVHPFFARPRAQTQIDADGTASFEPNDITPDEQYEEEKLQRKPSRRKKKDGHSTTKGKKMQKTLGEIVNPIIPEGEHIHDTANVCSSELDLNPGRRKRRRTAEHESLDVGSEVEIKGKGSGVSGHYFHQRESSPQVLIPVSSPLPTVSPAEAEIVASKSAVAVPKTPPKKVLRLNANGKFSSPPSKKPREQTMTETEEDSSKRRGRPRRSNQSAKKCRLLVQIPYPVDINKHRPFGEKIDRILKGEESVQTPALLTPKKAKAARGKKTPQKPAKALHPFFGGKPKEQPMAQKVKESPRKASAVTPGKLRMQTLSDQLHDSKEVPFSSALLKDRLLIKHPGAKEPSYPAREQAHVRGLSYQNIHQQHELDPMGSNIGRRKRKRANVLLPEKESVLSQFAQQLSPEEVPELRDDGFYEPNRSLHIPTRLLLAGEDIAKRVMSELSSTGWDHDDDELSLTKDTSGHPALRDLYDRIPAIMTVYDKCKGETLPWAQKHAPANSRVVLQPESETRVLRNWLESLAVQTVIGPAIILDKTTVSQRPDKFKKRRKKRPDDLDDFLVDSDEEAHEMSELNNESPKATKTAHRSMVQTVHNGAKLSNAVMLSGPHGCGKTAAAYAVAKELSFKVFEISSSERRTGRDVLDKVGDMTENHLVKHHGAEDAAALSSSEENGRLDDAFQQDLVSGKQGKMDTFFRPHVKAEKPQHKNMVNQKKMKAVEQVLKKPSKDQQQSLILLEEVDVLFKEDKEFWTTVLKLIITSKRPFIMTCNDEDMVPLQAMNLHAILRFCQPPINLATDYMLLIAAAEGHLLKRQAVSSLYEHHAYDLRASIAKLDYWCQMGVGDPRGGLTWIYQRWPPGSDIDQYGRTLRTVSSGTFQDGMGLDAAAVDVEDTLLWLQSEFGLDASVALGWGDMPQKPSQQNSPTGAAKANYQALGRYADFASSLSAADGCAANSWPGVASLDTTQPEVSEKARMQYIEGMTLLQTDEAVEYSALSSRLLICQLVTASRSYEDFGLSNKSPFKKIPTQSVEQTLSRRAFACFDPIATPSEASGFHSGMQQSAFDGTFRTIALDIAPYVRSIVQYDQALEEQRERLSLLGHETLRPKRARTTRAARSALEGGQRSSTRREHWFDGSLDMDAVIATGGRDWPRFVTGPGSSDEDVEIKCD